MRFQTPQNVTLRDLYGQGATFIAEGGEWFDVGFVAEHVVRVRHYPDGKPRMNRTWAIVDQNGAMPREGRQREAPASFVSPNVTNQSTTNGPVILQSAALRLTIHHGANLQVEVADQRNRVFHADVPRFAYAYNRGGDDVFHYVQRPEGELYYGFGERAGPLEKNKHRLRMVNHDALGYDAEKTDPLYKHCPFYITFDPARQIAYGLFYDNYATTTFDMGKEIDVYRGIYRSYQAAGGDLDYYVIYGPTIPQVIERYTQLVGRPMFPPRWTLGYLGSTMTYTEADDAQEQLKQFAQLCDEHDIPCDLFHLSSGYTTNSKGERRVFTWNRYRIPNPQQMVDDFHAAGIRLSPNVKPYLLASHPNYDEVRERGGFIRAADDETPETATFWAGGINQMGQGAYLDFTSEAGYGWWQEKARQQLLDYGIDSLWNDNNEYEIWDDAARCDGFGEPLTVGQIRPLQPTLMAHASYHALLDKNPDKRPFVLSRSGGVGVQRYAQLWSGDNNTSWHDMRYGIPMMLGSGLSGWGNNGNDVGGFYGPAPYPELLVRWVQNAIFHPRFTIHSWNLDGGGATEPWMYPEMTPHIREAIQLRYRLLPYLYTLLREMSQTGHPMMRPLVYEFPQDDMCHQESFQFMLGPHLLVATVLYEGARAAEVYLPQGSRWCDWHTGAWYKGGDTVVVDADLGTIPLFVRAGGLIPMGKMMRHVGAQPDDLREVLIFPSPEAGTSTFTLYEDDGESFGYQRGEYTEVALTVESDTDEIKVSVQPQHRGYALPYDAITFIAPPGEARALRGIGEASVGDDGRQRLTVPLHTEE